MSKSAKKRKKTAASGQTFDPCRAEENGTRQGQAGAAQERSPEARGDRLPRAHRGARGARLRLRALAVRAGRRRTVARRPAGCAGRGVPLAHDRHGPAPEGHGPDGRRHPGDQPEHPAAVHLFRRAAGGAEDGAARQRARGRGGGEASRPAGGPGLGADAGHRARRPGARALRARSRPQGRDHLLQRERRRGRRRSASIRSGPRPRRSARRSSSIRPAAPTRACASIGC